MICQNRNFKVALSADIEKIYRQILVHEEDRKYQAIIWRFDSQDKMSVFRLNTVTYGLGPSSFLAIRSLIQLANDYQTEHSLAAAIVRNEMYSDNVLTGAHSRDEAIVKIKDLRALFQKGRMYLRKWSSNDPGSLLTLTPDLLVTDQVKLLSQEHAVPILGIAWHTTPDCFMFHLESITHQNGVTKRSILSRIARLFDPLGWLGPVIVQAKILLQSLWLLKVDWDDPLPETVESRWSTWIKELPQVSKIRIPRWTGFTLLTRVVELHGFADASKSAFGAVLYLRRATEGKVSISLQNTKSKVAPIKTLSIPRLELCAAVLLVRIAKQFIESTTLDISDVHLWTDSADVLFWLKDHPSRWIVFVANRCSEIHTSQRHALWHHVRSKDNPADVLSRGISPSELKDHHLWWKGPAFLSETASNWSKKQDNLNFNVSSIITCSSYQTTLNPLKSKSTPIWDLIDKYSTLEKLLRITAYCVRFISLLLRKIDAQKQHNVNLKRITYSRVIISTKTLYISADEMENSLSLWVYLTQKTYFQVEYSLLSAGKGLNSSNSMANLNPIVVEHLIRVGGRLKHQVSNEDAKHPMILPHSSPLTTLLIKRAHLLTLHGGTQLTLATLRHKFWILCARTEVKKIIRYCLPCIRYAARTPTQLMGELPSARVRPSPPFQSSGVDYAGPISVRLTKSRGKGTLKDYICVFVCMATRAVHLELVEDYTSEAFIAAFHRFTARRGQCKFLYSDQGTTFVGADPQLKQILSESSLFLSKVTKELSNEGLTWSFNPPSAPHFGGLWEAAVKSMKHHMRRVIGV